MLLLNYFVYFRQEIAYLYQINVLHIFLILIFI